MHQFRLHIPFWLTDFCDTSIEKLKGGTIECILDGRSGEVTVHLAIPSDPLRPRLMCFSLEIDAFLTEQQAIQAAAVSMAGQQAIIVDDLVGLYKELANLASGVVELHPLFVAFSMSVQTDIAAACSLTLAGRADTALAVARRALETAGFARVIADDESAAQIWVFAQGDDKSWKIFKERFKTKYLYPRDGGFWQAVYNRYDLLSRMYHPGPDSFVRLEFNPLNDGKLRVATRQFEHGPEDSQTAVHNMWMILDVFALALAAFEMSVRGRFSSRPGYISRAALRTSLAPSRSTLHRNLPDVLRPSLLGPYR